MLCDRTRIISDRKGGASIYFLRTIIVAVALGLGPATAQDLTLRMPEGMVAEGFDKQLLPRFKFKHRIAITPVTEGEADMVFGSDGTRVFQRIGGDVVRLDIRTDGDAARTFRDWLKSGPGKAAIESFKPDGTQVYTTEQAVVVIEKTEVYDGDKEAGGRLALQHCGRCHVVDQRNRMGGIGSTPSFAALRARSNWSDLFRAFWSHNPHPSFTQVKGLTEPFDPDKALNIAPVEMTMDEVEAITAFVATLKPKELGKPVQSN
ncbi:MAG: hypothetical protein AAGA06_02790 [Pseudomonadota bacterium]